MIPAQRPLLGIAIRLTAVALLASLGALVKLAGQRGAHIAEIMFWRQAMAIPVILGWASISGGLRQITAARLPLHLRRTVTGLGGMGGSFGAMMLLPLADATAIGFAMPVLATLMAALLLRENIGIVRWSAVATGFAGMLVIVQPGFGAALSPLGVASGVFGALMVALVSIQLRAMAQVEPAACVAFWFSFLSLPILLIPMALFTKAHDAETWLLMMAIGLIGGLVQIAVTSSLRFAPVSTVLPMDYTALIWAALFGWLIWGNLPTINLWLGTPLVIAAGLVILWREQLKSRKSTS